MEELAWFKHLDTKSTELPDSYRMWAKLCRSFCTTGRWGTEAGHDRFVALLRERAPDSTQALTREQWVKGGRGSDGETYKPKVKNNLYDVPLRCTKCDDVAEKVLVNAVAGKALQCVCRRAAVLEPQVRRVLAKRGGTGASAGALPDEIRALRRLRDLLPSGGALASCAPSTPPWT
jgi:hypothetical protein